MSPANQSWVEQSEALMKALQTNQKTLSDHWVHVLGEVGKGWATRGVESGDTDETGEGTDASLRKASLGPIARQVAGTRATAEMLARFAEQFLAAGGRVGDPVALWQQLSETVLEPLRNASASGASGTARSPELFVQQLLGPWNPLGQMGQGALDESIRKLSGLQGGELEAGHAPVSMDAWDQLSSLVGDMAAQPSFGPIDPVILQRGARAYEAWLRCVSAFGRYETLRMSTWSGVGQRFSRALADAGENDKPVTSLRGLFELWVATGDELLLEMYRSDDYLVLQRELLESLMRYRIRLQDTREEICRVGGLPTRGELNDAYRAIHELRREVRRMKRDSASKESARASKRAASKKKSAIGKKAASKKKSATGKKAMSKKKSATGKKATSKKKSATGKKAASKKKSATGKKATSKKKSAIGKKATSKK